jgi:DNA-binding CsgD family transcriptional regulator
MAPLAAKLAVFVQSPELPPQMPGEAFAKLYGLTGGELRVLLVMASGLSVTETADMLGLGQTTVRTHLARAFRKTGTSKQSDLIPHLAPRSRLAVARAGFRRSHQTPCSKTSRNLVAAMQAQRAIRDEAGIGASA